MQTRSRKSRQVTRNVRNDHETSQPRRRVTTNSLIPFTSGFSDYRSVAISQPKLMEMIDQSPQVMAQRSLSAGIDNSPPMVVQRKQAGRMVGATAQPKNLAHVHDTSFHAMSDWHGTVMRRARSVQMKQAYQVALQASTQAPAQLQRFDAGNGTQWHIHHGHIKLGNLDKSRVEFNGRSKKAIRKELGEKIERHGLNISGDLEASFRDCLRYINDNF